MCVCVGGEWKLPWLGCDLPSGGAGVRGESGEMDGSGGDGDHLEVQLTKPTGAI